MKKGINVRLNPDLHQEIKEYAKKHKISISSILERSAIEFMERTRNVAK